MADKLIAKIEPKIDIHKIIDDAMEKKDRTVYILINGENTSISVTPLSESDPRWIKEDREPDVDGVEYALYHKPIYICSECGGVSQYITPYCPMCGEKLRLD